MLEELPETALETSPETTPVIDTEWLKRMLEYLKNCPEPLNNFQEQYLLHAFASLTEKELLYEENKRLNETVTWMHELIWTLIERIRSYEKVT